MCRTEGVAKLLIAQLGQQRTNPTRTFYALNSTYMDKRQIDWLESELAKDTSEWKICFFHHPPYSSRGKHGSEKQLREIVEPIFVKHGVNVVLTGHDHFYERIKPKKGSIILCQAEAASCGKAMSEPLRH